MGTVAIKPITEPKIRRAYADAILHIRNVEDEAISHIEQLLERGQ
jgi:hypothetical protein